jgi:KDO2-lipid IV(A) lauroyltransferase
LGSEYSPQELREIAHKFYLNLGITLFEFLEFPTLKPADLLTRVRVQGVEHLEQCRRQNQGAIVVSGHFGNWELLAANCAALGFPVSVMVKSQSNPYVDRLQNRIREQVGLKIIRQGTAARQLVHALRDREFVGILGDQDAGNQGEFVTFLGRPASVFRGPAYFAYRTGCPLLTAAIFRQSDGTHLVKFNPPLKVDPSWDEPTAIRELTRRHTRELEDFIRQAPEFYFWVHRRWKTQPPGTSN